MHPLNLLKFRWKESTVPGCNWHWKEVEFWPKWLKISLLIGCCIFWIIPLFLSINFNSLNSFFSLYKESTKLTKFVEKEKQLLLKSNRLDREILENSQNKNLLKHKFVKNNQQLETLDKYFRDSNLKLSSIVPIKINNAWSFKVRLKGQYEKIIQFLLGNLELIGLIVKNYHLEPVDNLDENLWLTAELYWENFE